MSLFVLILSILPGFAWLFFYLQEDPHPEPKRLVALTFLVGMASAFIALVAERTANRFFSESMAALAAPLAPHQFIYLLLLALIEEFAKFGAAWVSVHKNPEFDEPVDAMIYMVAAALGFATVENIGAIAMGQPGRTAILDNVFAMTSLRFVGATLLHSLASALLGYYWAVGLREMSPKKMLVWGLAFATALHGLFNYLIIEYGNIIYSIIFLLVIAFFVLNDFENLKRRTI